MIEWSLNPLVVIGAAIAVMFFGYFFGLFEGRVQGSKKHNIEDTEVKNLQPEPLPPASPPLPSDETPVLDLSRDIAGKLRLKLDGHGVDSSALNPEQRKRLIEILTVIRPWLVESKSVTPPAAPQPAPAAAPPPMPVPTPTPAPQPAAPLPDADDEDLPAPPQSIVAQIDSVLQARLMGTPLAEKGIRLQESLEGDVIIWVGTNKHDDIEDVPDEAIKAAFKAAVKEWENKYTPGL